MSKKQKAFKLAEELGLSIHKVHAAYVTGAGNFYYYIIAHKDAVAHDDFREHANPSKAYVYINEVGKHMTHYSWKDCIDTMQYAKKIVWQQIVDECEDAITRKVVGKVA